MRSAPCGRQPPLEPVSKSEFRVQRFLPTHLPARKIARAPCQPNTVKTHMRTLYAKVGANTRARPPTAPLACSQRPPASHKYADPARQLSQPTRGAPASGRIVTPRRTEQSFERNIGGHPYVKITTQIGYSRACATAVLTKVIALAPCSAG